MKRRNFIKISIFASSVLLTTNIQARFKKEDTKQIKSSIVILGAGFAGLSCAKFLKELNPNLNITLIEKKKDFISCPFSNAWLGDIADVDYNSLKFSYDTAIKKYKYNFVNEEVIKVNKETRTIKTENKVIKYDFLIMTLGIDYNYKKIFKKDKEKAKRCMIETPAGLNTSKELIKLKKMITNFKGGNFIISLPKSSYKCPPAPYERACMIANYFKKNKIEGKVIIIDPRAKPASKAKIFLEAFNTIYKDFIKYHPKTLFKDIDFDKKEVKVRVFDKKTNKNIFKYIKFNEASIIPPNRANKLYKKAKIPMYTQGWVKLKYPTFRTIDDEDIYVLGDAQGEYPYPKSAQMANSCAYVVAKEIITRIQNKVFAYKSNLPSSICYSLITEKKGAWLSHSYEFKDIIEVQTNTSKIERQSFIDAKNWYSGLTSDLFGLY